MARVYDIKVGLDEGATGALDRLHTDIERLERLREAGSSCMSAVSVQPGDTVICVTERPMSVEAIMRLRKELREAFPGNRVIVLPDSVSIWLSRNDNETKQKGLTAEEIARRFDAARKRFVDARNRS